ncbi:DUF2164 family protein [Paenibacillus sp. LMG 31456]|uniref:DUF2164 family protein n=1 Tax=Paenibacillus foliorum TaxID=2654974 RepID=A0A972K3R2_9BACL|nr:DUF2164 domain-containing protein [Paenibacillus foliorum]NOU95197.1 DUF2164 family protein [Paenibacillus foliorum]
MNLLKLPKEQKEQIISMLQQYFLVERGEELGHLAADQLLDFFAKHAGPIFYNQAVDDCRQYVRERVAMVEEDMYALEKPHQFPRK